MKLLFILLFGLSIFSCSHDEVGFISLEKIASAQSKVSARKYVNSGEVLDVPFTASQLKSSQTQYTDEDIAKLKAVAYKFYSNVKLKDGAYTLSAKKGEDIQISDRLFELMKNNLKLVNEWVEANRKKGIHTAMPEITQQTLDVLLK